MECFVNDLITNLSLNPEVAGQKPCLEAVNVTIMRYHLNHDMTEGEIRS